MDALNMGPAADCGGRRMTHRMNSGFYKKWEKSQRVVLDDRYAAEVDGATRRAEKAFQQAERRLVKAEAALARVEAERASESLRSHARQVVKARLDELNRLADLMARPDPTGVKHSGRGSVRRITNKGRSL